MGYSAGPLDVSNYDWFWDTYNPSVDYTPIVNDINNMGLGSDGQMMPEESGFLMDFDELNGMFGLVDLDLMTDGFSAADRDYLTSMGLDGYEMVNRAFTDIDVGGNLMAVNELLDQGVALTNQMIADANASFARNKILADIQESDIGKLEAAAEEFYYQTQKRNSDSFSNQISKFRGFLTSQYELDPETGKMVGYGSYHDKENASMNALNSAAYDLEMAVYDFMASPGYDNRFHEVDTRKQILSEDGETMIDNPDYMQSAPSQGLIDDYVYAPYMPDEDAQTIVERDLLNIPGFTGEGEILDSGERNTATGKLIAVALDLAGLGNIGTKLYLTQSTWNTAVNAVERGINKILGTGIDLPNINLHEFAATLLNEKFVDKKGKPILEGIANKAEWLIPFYDPTLSVNLAMLGGNELGKFDPTGENIFENIADALLEGPVLDAVQEASDAGKFKDIETDRGQGIMGFLGNMKAFVQSGGVAIQKVLGPGLSQAIVDFAFFDGLPVGQILNSIGIALGPQSAEDWKRYLEDKGIDPNNVEEKDISYYRALVDEYLTDPTTKPSGLTSLQEVTNGIDDGGVGARYLNTMNNWFRDTYGVNLDTIDPVDAAALMLNTIEDQRKYEQDAYMSPAQLQTAYDNENMFRSIQGLESISFEQFKADYEASVQGDVFKVDIGNGFSFDAETVKNITDEIEIGDFQSSEDKSNRLLDHANYILSDGNQGESLQNFYNSDIQLTSEAAMASTRTVDEDVYIIPDIEVTGYQFQYVTAPDGSDAAYDPLTGVTYALQEDRLINNPGIKDDRYDFPSLTYSDLLTSDKNLNPKRLKEIAKQGRIEYGELKKYVEENPYVYLGKSKETHRQDIVRSMIGGNSGWGGRKSVYTLADLSAEGVANFYSKYNINPSSISSVTGRDPEMPFDFDNMPQHTFTGDELRQLGVDIFSEDDLNIAGYMDYKGRKPNGGSQYYEFESASPITLEEYNNPAPKALRAFESELGNYYLRKYTGDNAELIEEIESNAMFHAFLDSVNPNNIDWSQYGYYDLEGNMINEGLVDSDLSVSISNTTYLEDFQIESDYKPSDYSLFTAPVSVPGQSDQTMLFVEDLETGIVEFYDNDRMNLATGKYEFNAPTVENLENARVRIPGTNNFSYQNKADIQEVLKYLYASGQISAAEVTEVDLELFKKEYDANFVIGPNGQPIGDFEYYSPTKIYNDGNAGSFEIDPETGDFLFMENYVLENPSVVGQETGLGETSAGSFYNLPDFNVIGFNNFEDLSQGYQDRLDFIDATSFDYNTKNFLKQNAYELYKSREAFLNLDETSQQLILDAQAEATSDFVDLGVFNVTASNATDLGDELTARMNIINAADLSEGQKQYEIDLANAIYNSKKTEINTLSLKNNSINNLTLAKNALEAKEEQDEEKILGLEATIEKIRSYEIPEFNVTAYLNAEDPSAYMQNFVNEVRKGTTEEFGNFLSIENADQILVNVAALAQSETDLQIVTTERDNNYQKYVDETQKYNTAISERDNAIQQRDANATKITELEGQLYIELDNFEVTATDIEGAQGQLNDFNTEIDRMVTDGEITSEQGELEKSLATNSFNVYKATQDIASLGTSTDTRIAELEADLKTAQESADSFEAEADEFEGKYNTTKADLEANQAYVLPNFNTTAIIRDVFGFTQDAENDRWIAPEGFDGNTERFTWLDNFEAELRADGILTDQQIATILPDVESALWARVNREMKNAQLVQKREQLSEAESRIGELEAYTLPDFTVEGVAAEDLDGTLSSYEQALTEDLNAELINQQQYDALYNSASELVLGQKTLNDANADAAQAEQTLNDKYDELQTKYDTYKLPDMRVTGGDFSAQVQSEEIGYYSTNVDGTDVLVMPDVPADWEGTSYDYRKSLRDQLVDMKREEFYDTEGNSVLTEAQIDDLMDDYRYAVEYWQSRQAWLYNSKIKTAQYNTLKDEKNEQIRGLEEDVEGLQTFSLPEFNITATNQVALDAYLDGYQNYVDAAEKAGNISAEQALNFDTIIASIRNNGSQIFTLEAANADKQKEIDTLKTTNQGLDADIKDRDNTIIDLTGTISVIGSGFDVTLYDDISDLDTGLASYIQGINDSDLDEEMKVSQIAFAQSMAEMRRENLYVPTYEAPDFNVIAEGDLTGLNTSYEQAMFTLDSFLDNEYITQEEYDANVADLNTAYNTRKDVIIPAYELPEFTVSELDAEGGFTNLDAEKEEFLNELQGFLDNDYITREEHDALEAQIESAYDTKKRDITPVYEAPDFTVYDTKLEPGEDFSAIDAEYNTARNTLDTNARLGYISSSEYIDQLNQLETSYEDARKGISPTYELPDFSVYGDLQEGDDFTEIDTAYQNELTRLEEYRDSGYISLSDYYSFLGDLETEYTARREGILPTYTMPDFSVTPASSLAELAEMEQAARDRFTMFSESEYFPEDFDILTEQGNLESLFDAERARLQGTYTLPEFAVEDTKGLLKQSDIENLFGEYETGLKEDVVSGMLGLTDFFSAMEGAQTTFDVEFAKRKPIQPREGDYAIIPDPINEGEDDQPSTGDFFGYVDDGNYPDQYGTIGGIDTSDILTGNYMAKLDPAYQLAELLLGQDRAKQMYPTGKSRGLADEQFQEIVNQFMLGQAEDAFEMQSGLSGKMQDLATEQRRLQRQSDLDLMAEFGDPYRQQLQELYPEQAAALKQQREIADIAAERAKGDLSPREQAQVEQQGYLFGAGRGREFDPVTLYKQLGEEVGVREGRETQATNQLTALMNMERGMYGDLPSVIGAQSPFIEGVGDITTPFNIGGIMDLGSTDFANQQRLQEVNMAIAQLDRDYQTAVALNQPSQAKSTLVKLNEYKAMADALGSTISAGQEAFGTLGSIIGGIGSIFGGGKSKNEAMMPSKSSAFLSFLDGF